MPRQAIFGLRHHAASCRLHLRVITLHQFGHWTNDYVPEYLVVFASREPGKPARRWFWPSEAALLVQAKRDRDDQATDADSRPSATDRSMQVSGAARRACV